MAREDALPRGDRDEPLSPQKPGESNLEYVRRQAVEIGHLPAEVKLAPWEKARGGGRSIEQRLDDIFAGRRDARKEREGGAMAVKLVRVIGGPTLTSITVANAETGEEIYVSGIELIPIRYPGGRVEVKLTIPATLELAADVQSIEGAESLLQGDGTGTRLPPLEPAKPPRSGAFALCSRGFLGLITSDEPHEVEYGAGVRARAWTGSHLAHHDYTTLEGERVVVHPGDPWSSREPRVLGYMEEIPDVSAPTPAAQP